MLTKKTYTNALTYAAITAFIGLFLFFGSIHSGGSAFYISMYFIPSLYLLYLGIIPFNNMLFSLLLISVLHYILWLLIVLSINKIIERKKDREKSI